MGWLDRDGVGHTGVPEVASGHPPIAEVKPAILIVAAGNPILSLDSGERS